MIQKRIYPSLVKLTNWEYWNSKIVYLPLYPYWAWLSIRARSFLFLTAANPGIKNGGYIMERKQDIYNKLPGELYPKTLYFEPGTALDEILAGMARKGLSFPVIVKPDIGERGMAVKKTNSAAELERYSATIPITFLVQEFIPYPLEAGIFYWRMPGETKGHISGVVNKEAVVITGDGLHTVAQLVDQNERYILYRAQLQALNEENWHTVPARHSKMNLMPYGNHCRGSKFTDEKKRLTPKLADTLTRICYQIPGFYYGRLDIRFESWEALEAGTSFSIIEVNGSGSEPTHIYDPANSIFTAWREITKHWTIMYSISKENNRRGTPYLTLAEGKEQVRQFREIEEKLASKTW